MTSHAGVIFLLQLPETNSEFTPENRPFNAPKGNEKVIPTIHFQVRTCQLVSGRGYKIEVSPKKPRFFPVPFCWGGRESHHPSLVGG